MSPSSKSKSHECFTTNFGRSTSTVGIGWQQGTRAAEPPIRASVTNMSEGLTSSAPTVSHGNPEPSPTIPRECADQAHGITRAPPYCSTSQTQPGHEDHPYPLTKHSPPAGPDLPHHNPSRHPPLTSSKGHQRHQLGDGRHNSGTEGSPLSSAPWNNNWYPEPSPHVAAAKAAAIAWSAAKQPDTGSYGRERRFESNTKSGGETFNGGGAVPGFTGAAQGPHRPLLPPPPPPLPLPPPLPPWMWDMGVYGPLCPYHCPYHHLCGVCGHRY